MMFSLIFNQICIKICHGFHDNGSWNAFFFIVSIDFKHKNTLFVLYFLFGTLTQNKFSNLHNDLQKCAVIIM